MSTRAESSFDVSPAKSSFELELILDLQRENLGASLPPEEAAAQGFVTVEHTIESLSAIHALAPSIVARAPGGELAGYALSMTSEAQSYVPILAPMFEKLAGLAWRGRSLGSVAHYVMGQVCVARPYRGQGVFDALYAGHRSHFRDRYELIVTEIATRNTRSRRAHERVGFRPLLAYRDDVDEWVIVAWDWR